MFEAALSKNARNSLAILGKSHLLDDFYLAGGTALALQLGHRKSEDFDFFTRKRFDAVELVRRLEKLLSDFRLDKMEEDTILAAIGKTRFTLFFYQYPLIEKCTYFEDIALASLKDIAAMKLLAISDRGTKRDFIDLYFLIKDKIVSLDQCFALYDKKYRVLEQNKLHIIKSLTYFKDADANSMPPMLRDAKWREVKRFFEEQIKTFVRSKT